MLRANINILNSISKTIVATMAHSRFEYVRSFELEDKLEPLNWIVLSIKCLDHKEFLKANKLFKEPEILLRDVMACSAQSVMTEMREISLGYGFNNIFHFAFQKDTLLFKRRGFKILSNVTSYFTSCFATNWNKFSNDLLVKLPVFDGSLYLLPQDQCLRDFLTKEQKDCHDINLEETTLRNLVQVSNMEYSEALKKVKKSNESEKNEMLFSLCNINYNNEPIKDKKGTILIRNKNYVYNEVMENGQQACIYSLHTNFNKDHFWDNHFALEHKTERNVKFNHLSSFKKKNQILPHSFLVVRIDGKGFHKFSELHNFEKPNDSRSLRLMTTAAQCVMKSHNKIIFAYGQSDEYSFVFTRFGHREKDGNSLISRIVSIFTASFVYHWSKHFDGKKLLCNPVFDARLVLYPSIATIRDYLSWRQADCHINNMYNTCFWKLVNEKGLSRRDAQEYLKGTFSKDKLAILKNEFKLEYSEENPLFRKGTVIYQNSQSPADYISNIVEHTDIIEDQFWNEKSLLVEKRATERRNNEIDSR